MCCPIQVIWIWSRKSSIEQEIDRLKQELDVLSKQREYLTQSIAKLESEERLRIASTSVIFDHDREYDFDKNVVKRDV